MLACIIFWRRYFRQNKFQTGIFQEHFRKFFFQRKQNLKNLHCDFACLSLDQNREFRVENIKRDVKPLG